MQTDQSLVDDINRRAVAHGRCAFWWLGQHSFVLKLGEKILYVDPFLSNLEGRQIPSLLNPSLVNNATVILGSHDHLDHIDRPAWPILSKASAAPFVIPTLLRSKISEELNISADRLLGIDADQSVEIEGIKITGVPAAHEFLDVDKATGLHPYLGFVIEGNGVCVYHAGDTCIYEGMQSILRRWTFDLAFLPINGRSAERLRRGIVGNMTYQEAADLAGTIKPGLTVPAHFEMFLGNQEDPRLFVDYVGVKYPGVATMIPRHGEGVLV